MRLGAIQAGKYTVDDRQKLTYGYDNNGNVTSLIDGQNQDQKQCFQYDYLNRLTAAFTGNAGCTAYSAVGIGPYDHTYGYNAIGNLTSYAGNSYTYGDAAHIHAVTAAFGNSYSYDANGNQTSRTINGVTSTITYNFENRLWYINGGGVGANFVYDADGNRVKSTVGGVTTVYIAGVFEFIENGATDKMTTYYEGNAMRRSGYGIDDGVFYLLQDHLKSSSSFVNQSGDTLANNYYYPYGGNRGGAFSNLTTKRFTGQYHESGLPGGEGLSYYNARWYDPKLGRFLSADTIVPGPANPQAFNRYSCVLNNPLKYTDPTGHCIANGQDGHNAAQNQLCLGYAGFIYNDGLANPDAFEAKWRVSPDTWWKNIGEQPGLGADFMKPHFDQAFSAFCGRSGLTCNPGSYVENPVPKFDGSPSIDGFALGAGLSWSRIIVSAGIGMEFVFSAKSGEIGLVTYSSPPGISIGSGSSRKAYFALINNLNQLEDYAGGTWSIEGTASTPYVGVVGSRFWYSTPGGTEGWTIGYAPGARLSGSFGWSSYSQPWIKYDLTTNQVSFPQVVQIIQAFSSNK